MPSHSVFKELCKLMGIFNIHPSAVYIPLIVNCKTNFRGETKSSDPLEITPIWYTEIE
jgi:hypothetical protein